MTSVLYVSCGHSALEYDDLSILEALGYDWFSTGVYQNPWVPAGGFSFRGPMKKIPDMARIIEYRLIHPINETRRMEWDPLVLSREFVDQFDVVVISPPVPYPFMLEQNWDAVKHKPILMRFYGQAQILAERYLNKIRGQAKLKIIRFSEKEKNIPEFAGLDFVIRPFVDENIYNNWNGTLPFALTFNNYCSKRADISNFSVYEKVFKKAPCKLFGQHNQGVSICSGYLGEKQQKQAYRDHRCYFALNTKPSPLTYNFVEAFTTGAPVIAWGPKLGNGTPAMYEIADIIENGVSGFLADSEAEAVDCIRALINDGALAKSVSEKGRAKALTLFTKGAATAAWKEAIDSMA